MNPTTRNAVNRALGDVATLMDVVVRVCAWCQRVQAVEPAATWGAPGVTHTMCRRCEPAEMDGGFDDAA